MNKAITDGLVFMPPAFSSGLDVWSSEDGTPGSATYDGAGNAALIPADQDFGGCVELLKTDNTQKLRYMGQVTILPGCYLRVTAKVKAISGNLPSVRIAGWAGGAGNAHVSGLVETGVSVSLTAYGEIVEVSAIIGTGARSGVDMVWGDGAIYGHLGLDLTGSNGGLVRVDDIVIEDITSAFHRNMMDWVDVLDYGAIGDGVADDAAAFEAADSAAAGRQVVVPAGVFYLGDHVSMANPVRFEGTVQMPDDKRLVLRGNYDLPSYVDAFGDELLGFKKAFQALLNFSDHESLDMGGMRIDVDAPIDLQAAEGTKTTFEIRRVIRNGQFNAIAGPAWDPGVVVSAATYSVGSPNTLSNVVKVATIEVGSLIVANGVGREVYVTDKNVGAGTITLSQPLYDAAGTQSYTFTRFKYILDCSGFTKLSKFTLTDVEFYCSGIASGVLLAPAGQTFHLKDCFVTKPRDRGVTSHGRGCQDLQIDRCHFVSNEQSVAATARSSIAFNVNANDAKIRDNRFERFGHTGVLFGNGHLIVGNHLFQGDNLSNAPRLGGLVFTYPNLKSVITGNYIDNCSIEWTNEHDVAPDFGVEYSFGGLTVTGNIFTTLNAASWFKWIVIKPFGTGHFVQGLSVVGNTFKTVNGSVDRIETVDTSIAGLDFGRSRNILFEGNTFNGVTQATINPVTLEFERTALDSSWTLNPSGYLPFQGWARNVTSIVAEGPITKSGGSVVFDQPYATVNYGGGNDLVQLIWPVPVKGKVVVTTRMDNPF
ncbi:MAG: right-handed parallel beta-helix repeat-containing protein [Paracoccaceae bacterium]